MHEGERGRQTERLFQIKKTRERKRWRHALQVCLLSSTLALSHYALPEADYSYENTMIINVTLMYETPYGNARFSFSFHREARGHGQLHNALIRIQSLVSRTLQ